MKKIKVVVTTDEQMRRAEYVSAHWQEISFELNGIYFDIERGDSPVFDCNDSSENDPSYIKLYNRIFRESEDVPEKRDVGRPAEMSGGKKVNTYLDAESIETAKRLGNGNVSEGIRIALAAQRDSK